MCVVVLASTAHLMIKCRLNYWTWLWPYVFECPKYGIHWTWPWNMFRSRRTSDVVNYPPVNSHSYWTWPFIDDLPVKNDDFQWPTLPPAGRVSGEHATSHASTPLLEMYTMVYTPDETPLPGLPDQIRGCRGGLADRRIGGLVCWRVSGASKTAVFFSVWQFSRDFIGQYWTYINYKILWIGPMKCRDVIGFLFYRDFIGKFIPNWLR